MTDKRKSAMLTLILVVLVSVLLLSIFMPRSARTLFLPYPSISSSDDAIYIAWIHENKNENKIFFRKSADKGESWSDATQISVMSDILPSKNFLSIASDGNNVYVAWDVRIEDGNNEIFFKKSIDGGESWSEDIRLTNAQKISTYPTVRASGKNVYLIWDDARHDEGEITENYQIDNWEIYFKKSEDGGETWSEDVRLTNAPMASWQSDMEIDGNDIYVVWSDWRAGTSEIFFKKSEDGGETWSEDVKLTERTSKEIFNFSIDPKIKKGVNNLYVVWADWRMGAPEIFLKISDDLGKSWSEDIKLTNLNESISSPIFVVDDKKLYLVFNSKSLLYLMEFDIRDLALLKTEIISEITDYKIRPKIAQDDKYLYIVGGTEQSALFKKIEK